MKSKTEYEFCMSQFKPAIVVITILVVVVIGWMVRDCMNRRHSLDYSLIAATVPMGPPILVKDKATHPYWGNCSKCHLTTNAGKPVSKVMVGPPISIKQKMTHDDWGNCLLCHQITDGIQPGKTQQSLAKAAAANQINAQTLGLNTQTVTAAMMKQFGLPNEDGVLVLEVALNSIGASAGMLKGDEIIRVGKTRIETISNLDTAIAGYKPGETVQFKIYRGNKSRNIYALLPDKLLPAAATAPMTQNQVETLAEQLGVPKTQQAVTQALQKQNQAKTVAANIYYGKVAIASTGPGLGYSVSPQFGASPYFVVLDPTTNSYSVATNPNAGGRAGQDIQTGQYMVDLGVSNVVAGGFTPNAMQALQNMRVNVYPGVTGPVQDAISAYVSGNLVTGNTSPAANYPGGARITGNGNLNQQVIY